MRAFLTGGAGAIGSFLVDRLVADGHDVVVFDNLSAANGFDVVMAHVKDGTASFIDGDVTDQLALCEALSDRKPDIVFHLAADGTVPLGPKGTYVHVEQNTIGVYNVLESMRRTGVRQLVFSSSATVYGDTRRCCSESDLGHLPISLYGASKWAGEALISAFAEQFDIEATIFRFGNVVGPRSNHGVIHDLMHKLAKHPADLEVLGDGKQIKPYLHVTDCVDGMLHALGARVGKVDIFNLAPFDVTSVDTIARACIAASPYPDTLIRYTGGERGWKGDVPVVRLDPGKMAMLGWRSSCGSDDAVTRASREIAAEVWPT
jgi:UDP-glucose 4-epimerase